MKELSGNGPQVQSRGPKTGTTVPCARRSAPGARWLVASLCLLGAWSSVQAQLFSDNFTRGADPVGLTSPWATNSGEPGSWSVTGGELRGGTNGAFSYGFAYVATNAWTNYSVSAKVRFSTTSAYGGGIGGRLNVTSGSRYAAWIFPEVSPTGLSNVVRLIKFHTWGGFDFLTGDLPVASVGTTNHTVRMEFMANQIGVYYDGVLLTNYTHVGSTNLTGGISVDMWTDSVGYSMDVDDVAVSPLVNMPLANNDSYSVVSGLSLTVSTPGILGNDTGGVGPLSAVLVSSPTKGNFSFNTNGSFSYAATNNYSGPDSFTYRASDGVTNSSVATVAITVTVNASPVANADSYTVPANVTSAIAEPGVLANDTDANGNNLTAVLVANPTNGTVKLRADGGFSYKPNTNYTGPDVFTYRANDGSTNSTTTTATLTVTPGGIWHLNNFNAGSLAPWQTNAGTWAVTNGVLLGGTNAIFSYAFAYLGSNWTDYSVSAKVQFPVGAFGGGIGGRLNTNNGAHYAAWVYPENSAGGSNRLRVIKFSDWATYSQLDDVGLKEVGTNAHTVELAFSGSRIAAYFDGVLRSSVTDAGGLASGGITVDMWTDAAAYFYSVDDMEVSPLLLGESFTMNQGTTLTNVAPGVLANDTGVFGTNLTATLLSVPDHGTLNFSTNGGFTYTPTNNYVGDDNFSYSVSDGGTNLGSAAVNLTVVSVNSAPVLPAQTNRTIAELTALTVTNTATDADLPNDELIYSLTGPTGATINTNTGVITWSPTEAQGPSANTFTTIVSDIVGRRATNNFTVTVSEVNLAPVLTAQTNRTIVELTTLSVTNLVTDQDAPTNTFTYSMLDFPSGATINTNTGVITWSPTEAQGPGTNTITTVVTDNGVPSLSATNSFTVTVTEVNAAPLLPAQTNRTIGEFIALTVTNTATDPDSPTNTLAYLLLASPTGAILNTNTGIITWTPGELDGSSTNTFTTVVTDNGSPNLSATNTFSVVVTEVNEPPVLAAQTNRTVAELTTLTVTNTASDADVPANTLTYSLSGPTNATMDASGVITWTPTEAQGPSTNVFTTMVSDGTASATNSFVVVVTEVNEAPVLAAQTNRTVAELTTLTVTNTASDADVPANTLTYSLSGPTNATMDASGVITWTPTEAQGPSTNVFTTMVSDGTASATNSFVVVVTEVNEAPVLATQTNRTVAELTTLTVTNTASDADVPANTLTYSLSGPTNATMDASGVITWTPTEAQGPSTNVFTTMVSDGTASATNSFVVVVTEVNEAPVLATQTNRTVAELTTLTVTNTASDADVPANTLTYSLSGPTNATMDASGVITWTPTEAQGPSTNVFTTMVSDGTASATNSFVVVVTEVNSTPVASNDVYSMSGGSLVIVAPGILANDIDGDLPANLLTAMLVSGPAHGSLTLNTNGGFTYTPTGSLLAFTGTDSFTYRASDGQTNSAVATVNITVSNASQFQFRITALTMSNGVAQLTWNSESGTKYRVQYKNDLADTNWTDLPPDVTATGPASAATDSSPDAAQRYYRVVFVPTAVPEPEILSIGRSDGISTISWSAVAGRSYRVFYKTSVTDLSWNPLPPDVTAAGATASTTDAAGDVMRFYKVVLLP